MYGNQRGFQLLELLVVLTLGAVLAALIVPALQTWSRGTMVRLAAAEIAAALQTSRLFAIRHRVKVAVKFRTAEDGEVTYTLYRDGNRNGVRNRDIDAGTDPEVRAPRRLAHFGRLVRFGFPEGEPPRDPGDPSHRMDRLDDPIRFNRSDLASFSPFGTATPGTVYLSDGVRHLTAVRVTSRSGRIRVLRYDLLEETWHLD